MTSDDAVGHVTRDFVASAVALVAEYLSAERADALADLFGSGVAAALCACAN